jgi:hypothetical protein
MNRALAYSETAYFALADGSGRRIALVDHAVLAPNPERDRLSGHGTGEAEPTEADLGVARLAEAVDDVPLLPLLDDVRVLEELDRVAGPATATLVSFTGDEASPHRWAEREVATSERDSGPVQVLRGSVEYETCGTDAGGVVLVPQGRAPRVAGILHHTTTKGCSSQHHAYTSVAHTAERLSALRERLEDRAETYRVGAAEAPNAERRWLLLERGYSTGSRFAVDADAAAQQVVVELIAHEEESLFVGAEPLSLLDLDRTADGHLLPPDETRYLCGHFEVPDRERCVIDVSDGGLDTLHISVFDLSGGEDHDFAVAAWSE